MSWVSPCRSDPAKGARRHRCSWWHAHIVSTYQAARAAQEDRAEEWAIGYTTELAAFYAELEAPITFRDWLIKARGSGAPA